MSTGASGKLFGNGLMNVEKISAITLKVSDMRTSVRFYKNLLGLKALCGGEQAYFSSVLTLCRRAGIPNFSWHCFRHTFASRLVMAGIDIRTAEAVERLVAVCDTATDTKPYGDEPDWPQGIEEVGGGGATRTHDLGIMRPSLCRLSYAACRESA